MVSRRLSDQDREFVLQAQPMNIAEVKLGELARDYAWHNDVKQLGRKLMQDHNEANRKLAEMARNAGIGTSDQMDLQHQQIEDRLLELEGDEFDREFLRAQLNDHQRMISLFEREASEGEDPDIRKFAQGHVPVLQQHMRQIQGMTSSMRA